MLVRHHSTRACTALRAAPLPGAIAAFTVAWQRPDHFRKVLSLIGSFVDLLNEHAAFLFNATSDGLGFLIDGLIELMQACPPLLLVALFAGLAFALHRSLPLALTVVAALLLIMNLGYWAETIETLALVIFATGLCMLVGVPIAQGEEP